MADAIATTAGAMLGTSTTTTYVESAAGVAQGGRSGLTAFTVAICFAVALFFSPLFLSIPSAATAPALIIVGLLMIEPITKIPFDDFSESIPAFVCIIMMPLTYSISNGILLGMIAYILMNLVGGKFNKISPTMYILAVLFVLTFIFIKDTPAPPDANVVKVEEVSAIAHGHVLDLSRAKEDDRAAKFAEEYEKAVLNLIPADTLKTEAASAPAQQNE
jgi:hypothetical protein